MSTPAAPAGGHAVVAGVDSRRAAGAAVRAAAEAARGRGLPLWIVSVLRHAADPGRSALGMDAADQEAESWAYGRLDAAAENLRTSLPGLDVRTACLWETDLDRSQVLHGADLVVLGHRGLHGDRAFGLRTISRSLLRAVRCPVLVVPDAAGPERGPVVAGVGRDLGDVAVLAAAAQEAHRRGAGLDVVHAWVPLPGDRADDGVRRAEATVWGMIRAAVDDLPVPTVTVLTRDPAAEALERHARDASLVVVGSRSGALAGLLHESVSHRLLGDPPCPVLVVPRGGDRAGGNPPGPHITYEGATT